MLYKTELGAAMKVGDLVVLSSYGVKRDYNNYIWSVDPEQTGIIIKVDYRYTYQYRVHWSKAKHKSVGHMRRELKYAYR